MDDLFGMIIFGFIIFAASPLYDCVHCLSWFWEEGDDCHGAR